MKAMLTPRAGTNEIMKRSFLSGASHSTVPTWKSSSQPVFDSHRKLCTVGRSLWGSQETNRENKLAGSEQTAKQDEMMGYRADSKTRSLSRYNYTASSPRHDWQP